ncbi:amino acid adenylation domain-containing protein [Streptomyces sp. NPDC021093]|uniref:amino acid adenylation domain-containing protein n=1 Tax=Streptomyces sp. NPDC021093 TaxID=3365112 RepID=UPI003793396F
MTESSGSTSLDLSAGPGTAVVTPAAAAGAHEAPASHGIPAGWAPRRAVRAETIHGGFEAQAARTPRSIALRARGTELTYEELNARANVLAHRLRAHGVGAESLVVVCLPRSVELLVSFLAVLKAGGAYVPLSPGDPVQRRRHIVQDARPTVVLTDADHRGAQEFAGSTALCVDELLRSVATAGPAERGDPAEEVRPEQLAYVIYTSGSSGRPKGVMCPHRGVANYLDWAVETYTTLGADGAPLFSSVGFDMVVPNIYAPLWCGQAVRLVPDDQDLPAQISEVLASGPYGFIKLTPGQLDLITSMTGAEGARSLAGLLAVGADLFPTQSLQRWRALDATTPVLNEYGPTEASVANAFFMVPDGFSGETIPIGRPIENTSMYILDDDFQQVPAGAEGEIFIGGVCCARGYLGRPDLSSEKFVPDPYAPEPGARMYRTGDRATWDDLGNAVFLGRSDRQLKIRGHRVEPGETEAALRRHPDIQDAAVVGHRTSPDAPLVLKAYLVVDGAVPDGLVKWLAEHVPDYAVPRHYAEVDSIPLDANGKADRSALARQDPEPERAAEGPGAEGTEGPGAGSVEDVLREAWKSVLGVTAVDPDANFFELGGDSISTVRLASKLREQGYELSLTDVFRCPTLHALASLVVRSDAVAETTIEVGGPLSLTPIQQWFMDRDPVDRDHHNQSVLLEWKDEPEVFALETALEALVNAHDALRMRFVQADGRWQQEVGEAPPGFELLSEVHLDQDADDAGPGHALQEAATELQRSLDIGCGQVLRAALISGAERPPLLLIAVHHLVVDTFSWPTLVRDLDVAYTNLVAGREPGLSEDAFVFSQWASALAAVRPREAAPSGGGENAAPEPVSLPRDVADGANTVGGTACVEVRLPSAATRHLLRVTPSDYSSPVESVLLTALTDALSAAHDLPSVTFDVERHGRDSRLPGPDRSAAVGWFAGVHRVTLDSFTLDAESDPGLRDAVHRMKQAMVAGPADRLECDIEAAPANPGTILFNYSGHLETQFQAENFSAAMGAAGEERSARQERSHDIELEVDVTDDQLTFRWLYAPTLHSRQAVESVARRCMNTVELLVRRGSGVRAARVPSDFPLASLTREQLDRVLKEVGRADDLYDLTPLQSGMLLHSLMGGGYGGCHLIECAPGLDESEVADVWRELVRRHPVLRSSVHWQGLDRPVQVVHPVESVDIEIADWSQDLVDTAGDPGRDWRPRVTVARTGDDRLKVVLNCHHLWIDGWSVGVLTDEASRLHEARTGGEGTGGAGELPVPVPYRRYVEWLRDPERQHAAHTYWSGRLEGSRACYFDPTGRAGAGGERLLTVDLSADTRTHFRQLVSGHGVTPAVATLAAWAVTLSAAVDRDDVMVGCVVDGRSWDLAKIDRIVGLVMNTVPVVWDPVVRDPAGSATVATALAGLRDQLSDTVRFGHHSLAALQRSVPGARGELFDTVFVVEDVSDASSARTFQRELGYEEVHYPLSLTLLVENGQPVALRFAFHDGGLDPERVRTLADHVVTALGLMTSHASGPASALRTML